MIPKIIHYCNFGDMKMTPLLQKCRESWHRYCGDYELMEWNEETFEPYRVPFFDEAMRQKKYAFASDYARAFVLHEFGGIYLDTDVELRHSLDPFLAHRAFTGFEIVGYPFTALWGSEKGHSLARRVTSYYQQADFSETTNTTIVSRFIVDEYGIDPDRDTFQIGKDGLAVYPSTTFSMDAGTSVAIHHFAGSWVGGGKRRTSYKQSVSALYYGAELARLNALTAPPMFEYVREHVGLAAYFGWLLHMTAWHCARRIVRAIPRRR